MRYCKRPTRIKSSVSCVDIAPFVTIPVAFGIKTPENAVEILVIIELNVEPTLYTATTAVLVSIPNINLSVAQNNMSTIEPINTNKEKLMMPLKKLQQIH